ncbi:uncharacterized protein [Temnothorax longispinosus]|uniref:uncharacterized protein isoform X3 n=1 Tax=Temnothorax longispinosus TaxID=300112 RepID=UPI003A994CD2
MMYFIVEFGDNAIAMIPENWLNEDKTKAKWPPYKDDGKIMLAIDKMELPTSDWSSFDVLRIISTADCYETAVKKLKSAETSSDVDDVFTDIKTRHSRAKVVLTDNAISSDQENMKDKKKKKNMPPLPKAPSTLCDKFAVPLVSDTSKKQNMKKVKKMSVNNKCTTTATSSFEDSNVKQRNNHYLDLSDNEDYEISEKKKKLLLSGNSSKDVDIETSDCPTVMKQSTSTLSSRKSLFTKNLNTLLLTRQTNNEQEYDKNLSFKINLDKNANNVNNVGNMTKQKNVSYRKEVSSNLSLDSSTADEKLVYLIVLQKVLQKLSTLVVQVELLNKGMSTIANNEQNTTYKQQNIEEAESESLEEIFPLRTQEDLYSFDKKLANKTCSREVLINYFLSIGGRDFKEMITNILKEILADSVAVQFSWDGRKKECFRNLHILKEITKAVRRRWPSQDLNGIKPIISRWLINAKLRISRATSKKSEKEFFTEDMDDEEENTSDESES